MLAVAGGLATLLQLRGESAHLGAEAADLLRRLGEVLRLDLHLGSSRRDRPQPVPAGMPGTEGEPAGRAGKRRTAGQQRNLRLARRVAERVAGVLGRALDRV